MNVVVNMYLTWNCNFRCGHCIHSAEPGGKDMSDEQLDYAFRFVEWLKTKNLRIPVVGLTGGEPTLHPNFWGYVMAKLAYARQFHQSSWFELHTNASIPVPPLYKECYWKFFTNIYVGHDAFHRKFKLLSELYLQDYSEISHDVHLRYNGWKPNGEHCTYIKLKGRGANLPNSTEYVVHPTSDTPKHNCNIFGGNQEVMYVNFTPDSINTCGEKSHPLPDGSDSQWFKPYTSSFEELLHNSLDYHINGCNTQCSQPCSAAFYKKKDTP